MAHTMLLSGHSAPACSRRGGCSSRRRAAPVAVAAALLPQRPTCRAAPAAPPAAFWLLQLQAATRQHPHGARNATLVARSAAPASDSSSSSSSSSEVPDVEQDFDLLSTQVAELSKVVSDEMRGCSIFLVGMMGSGKSTVGKMLANTLRYAYFDTDSMIELAHDKKAVAEIFAEYGQEYFRSCEAQVIKELSPYKNLVVATGGGAVINPENWGYMRQGVVVWLSGDVALLARRVAKDGISKRPLLAADLPKAADGSEPDEGALYGAALEKLKRILDDRQKFYLNADLTVSLEGTGVDAATGAPTAVVMYRLLQGLDARIQKTKQDREERRNFKIEYASDVPTMRTVESPVAQAQQQQQQQGGAPPPAA